MGTCGQPGRAWAVECGAREEGPPRRGTQDPPKKGGGREVTLFGGCRFSLGGGYGSGDGVGFRCVDETE